MFDALGEAVDCVQYDSWMVHIPEGQFLSRIGPTEFYKVSSGNNNQSNHPLQPFLSICLYRELSFTECHSLNREQSMTIYLYSCPISVYKKEESLGTMHCAQGLLFTEPSKLAVCSEFFNRICSTLLIQMQWQIGASYK